jgi:hypothetical protein
MTASAQNHMKRITHLLCNPLQCVKTATHAIPFNLLVDQIPHLCVYYGKMQRKEKFDLCQVNIDKPIH